jgi:hypothetical protein
MAEGTWQGPQNILKLAVSGDRFEPIKEAARLFCLQMFPHVVIGGVRKMEIVDYEVLRDFELSLRQLSCRQPQNL